MISTCPLTPKKIVWPYLLLYFYFFVIQTELEIALSYAYTTDCGKFCSVFTDFLLNLLALCSFRIHQMSSGDIAFAFEVSQFSHLSFQPCQFSSVAQSCPTLCDPMNRRTPGLLVHHQLPEFTQTHVHWVSDAIQPSHPLSSPCSPAPSPSQHQSLFQWVNSLHEVAKVLEFQL